MKIKVSTKMCSGFDREAHEVSLSGFYKSAQAKDGLRTQCKDCQAASVKWWKDNPREVVEVPVGMRRCTGFDGEAHLLPLSEFTKGNSRCRECKKADYRARNPLPPKPEVSEGMKLCSGFDGEAHEVPLAGFNKRSKAADGLQGKCRECDSKSQKEYYDRLSKDADWRRANQAKVVQWQANNPERFRANRRAGKNRRRALELGAELSPGIENCLIEGYELAMHEDDCAWCGKELTEAERDIEHIYPLCDRKTPGKGTNDPTNLVASCKRCNSSKGIKDPFEWCEWLS